MSKFSYIFYPDSYKVGDDDLRLIDQAAVKVAGKLKTVNLDELAISDYNKQYLKRYVVSADFYISQYVQLFLNLLSFKHIEPSEASIIDYGGGCGILSAIASEIGFKTIIYNDIYAQSVKDAEVIVYALGSRVNHYVTGDIAFLVEYMNIHSLRSDYVCSFDVLEHIYDWQKWFDSALTLNNNPLFVFKTSANGANPIIRRRLAKIHNRAEYIGREKGEGWKERDTAEPFLKIRRNIIEEYAPQLSDSIIDELALSTRGLMQDDIILEIDEYIKNGKSTYRCKHATVTCDPYTGNWAENDIDTKDLQAYLTSKGFDTKIVNGFYSYSANKTKSLPKTILNLIVRFTGFNCLLFSPSYTLIARNKLSTS